MMDREALRTAILSHITPPAIADRVVDAKAAGILPDTGKNLRTSLQAAIEQNHHTASSINLTLPTCPFRFSACA